MSATITLQSPPPQDVEACELDFVPHDSGHSSSAKSTPATRGDGLNRSVEPNGPFVDTIPSITDPYINRWRGAAAFFGWLVQGMNDSVPGALLLYIEEAYRTSYAITSLIFVGNALGFIAAAPLVDFLERKFGRAKVLGCAAAVNVVAYAVMISQPPFAVVVICFAVLGFGFSTILALNSSFIANLQHGTSLLGVGQGGYGIGGTIAPLIGTALAAHGVRWSFFYFIPFALSIGEAALFFWSFRGFLRRAKQPSTNSRSSEPQTPAQSVIKKALKDRTTLLACVFLFAYQGAEVTISGWVVSFLIDYRNGDPAHVGYVTSGFWGGITVGRFLLCPIIHRLGDRICLLVLIFVWAGFQLILWFVPNVIGDAVAVAIIGLLSGPVAPCATGVLSTLLDPDLQITGLGLGWSVGSGGAAIAPFLTGLLAQKFGTVVLNPICIVLCAIMEGAWLALPGRMRKQN